jgi:hypothetical protein
VLPDSGGSRVEITIERIKEIARTTMEQLQSDARSGSSDFRNTHLSEGAFGEVPKALAYAAQQEAAAGVFRDTIDGVLDDLAQFQQNLLASAEAHERNDEAVASALTALSARYGPQHQYSAEKEYDEGRHDAALKVPEPREDGASTEPGATDTGSQGTPGVQGTEGRSTD